jgi:hypothetical protein
MRHRHVRHHAFAEEALLAREGAVDKLVDDHEVAGGELLLQRAAGRQEDQVGATCTFQDVDIGAVVELARAEAVAAPVAGQEDDVDAVRSPRNPVGWLAPRRGDACQRPPSCPEPDRAPSRR